MASIILPSTIPSIVVGGRVFTDLDNLIILNASVIGTTNTNSTPRLSTGSAGYQVTTGKTLKIWAWKMDVTWVTVVSTQVLRIGYQDNDVGMATSTGFTNRVFDANGGGITLGSMATLTQPFQEGLCSLSIPAGKYMGIEALTTNIGNCTVRFFGYEV